MDQKVRTTTAPAIQPAEDAPQSGPGMLRYALQKVMEASEKGHLAGLYGPLHAYIEQALLQAPPAPTQAEQFVAQVARMSIWGWQTDDGTAYKECEIPANGDLDSHCTLMNLIEHARKVSGVPSVAGAELTSAVDIAYLSEYLEGSQTLPFSMTIEDRRKASGKCLVTISRNDGKLDDELVAALEIARLPGSKTDMQGLHLHFDHDRHAASFYKQGNRFIVRLADEATLAPNRLPGGERVLILE
jgi:hypothetical protein